MIIFGLAWCLCSESGLNLYNGIEKARRLRQNRPKNKCRQTNKRLVKGKLALNKEENILWKRVLGKIKIVSVALGRVFGKIHKRFWGKVGRSFNNND